MHTHIVPQLYINNDNDGDDHKIKLGYYSLSLSTLSRSLFLAQSYNKPEAILTYLHALQQLVERKDIRLKTTSLSLCDLSSTVKFGFFFLNNFFCNYIL